MHHVRSTSYYEVYCTRDSFPVNESKNVFHCISIRFESVINGNIINSFLNSYLLFLIEVIIAFQCEFKIIFLHSSYKQESSN